MVWIRFLVQLTDSWFCSVCFYHQQNLKGWRRTLKQKDRDTKRSALQNNEILMYWFRFCDIANPKPQYVLSGLREYKEALWEVKEKRFVFFQLRFLCACIQSYMSLYHVWNIQKQKYKYFMFTFQLVFPCVICFLVQNPDGWCEKGWNCLRTVKVAHFRQTEKLAERKLNIELVLLINNFTTKCVSCPRQRRKTFYFPKEEMQ